MKRIFTFVIALMSVFATTQLASAANVVFNVTVPSPTYECYIVGSFQGWAITTATPCTKVDDTHYTVTLDDATFAAGVTKDNMEYKYACGTDASWGYIEKNADGSERGNRKYADGNGTDVVAKWAAVYNPTTPVRPGYVTIDALTSDSVQVLYLAGTFNNWAGPLDSTKMTISSPASGGVIAWTIRLWVPDANALQFNFCAGPGWDYAQKTPSNNFVFPVGTDIQTAVQVQYFKKIYDQSLAGTVNLKAIVPAGTDSIWIVGSFSLPNWSFSKAILGTKNLDGTFSFVVPNVISFSYVCVNKLDWAYKELDPTDPTQQHKDRSAAYPADNNSTITVSGWKGPSAISEVKAATNLIYTNNSSIVVEGVTNNVSVFDIAGRNIQSMSLVGTFTSKSLNAGLYIVRVDGATRKVAVK
ncbi:MAG: T9SS type A sorting domain-containing protein [Paludibacter sp.]